MKASWNGETLAESHDTIVVEGNHYFPPGSIDKRFFKSSDRHTVCPWKGTASYYDIEVGGNTNSGAAWFYPEPKSAASNIAGFVAFWKGVTVA